MNVVFDLDGTLIDSRDGITSCFNVVLSKMGRPQLPIAQLTWVIGPPLRESFRTLLDTDDKSIIETAFDLYHESFRTHGVFENRLFDGVRDLLEYLHHHEYTLMIATSKESHYIDIILDRHGIHHFFRTSCGATLDGRRQTKREILGELVNAERILPREAVMIGDRDEDVTAAKACGLHSIGVTYGVGGRLELERADPDYLADTPADIANHVDRIMLFERRRRG